MKRVTVVGAEGFVGSAFTAYLAQQPDLELTAITRANYTEQAGISSDVTIDAAANSRKYLADEHPVAEFDQSVTHRFRTLTDFPARLQIHLSSVDVYSDLTSPETTREDSPIESEKGSNYGFHKFLAEELVKRYSDAWLIIRLAGMVGSNLRKNPVFDVLHSQPLRIHPDSRYQFIPTCEVARIVWDLSLKGIEGETFNLCGNGLISPRQIAALANRTLDLSQLDANAEPRIVDINLDKIKQVAKLPETYSSVKEFVETGIETSVHGDQSA